MRKQLKLTTLLAIVLIGLTGTLRGHADWKEAHDGGTAKTKAGDTRGALADFEQAWQLAPGDKERDSASTPNRPTPRQSRLLRKYCSMSL